MPDANGQFKGSGWTAKQAAGWERVFGSSLSQETIDTIRVATKEKP